MLPKDYKKEDRLSDYPSQFTMAHLKEDPSTVKLRVLTDFITGKEVFGEKDGKPFPYRFRVGEKIPVGCIGSNRFTGEPNTVKGFLAAIVWNYTTNQVEILSVVNNDIKDAIFDLEHDGDWGDCKNYDLTIKRTGQKVETRYKLTPSNLKKFEKQVDISGIDMEALYGGENPFENYKRPKSDEDSFLSSLEVESINDNIPF